MKELIEFIAKSLVDKPEDVSVRETEGEKTTIVDSFLNCIGSALLHDLCWFPIPRTFTGINVDKWFRGNDLYRILDWLWIYRLHTTGVVIIATERLYQFPSIDRRTGVHLPGNIRSPADYGCACI